jgi:hypothetical protein
MSCPTAGHCTARARRAVLAAQRPRPGLPPLVCAQGGGGVAPALAPGRHRSPRQGDRPSPLPSRRAPCLRGPIPTADTAARTCSARRGGPAAGPRGPPAGAARALERQLRRRCRGRSRMALTARGQSALGRPDPPGYRPVASAHAAPHPDTIPPGTDSFVSETPQSERSRSGFPVGCSTPWSTSDVGAGLWHNPTPGRDPGEEKPRRPRRSATPAASTGASQSGVSTIGASRRIVQRRPCLAPNQ